MSVTKEFAVKIDTQLSELHDKRWNLRVGLLTDQESLAFYQKNYPNNAKSIAKYEEKIKVANAELRKVFSQICELDEIYDEDPWTRAFLVVSSDGHVHNSLDCSTCFPTTRFSWLVEYSNDDENAIVDAAGELACTICYPSAPAEILNRPTKIVIQSKVEKEKARQEREAKKAAKIAKAKADAPTASGESLYFKDGKYTEEIRTERTAVSEWNNLQYRIQSEVVTHYYNGEPHTEESIQHQKDRIIQAQEKANIICQNLAEKHGVSFDQQLKILQTKYNKRRDR